MKYTILGAGGAIGNSLAYELLNKKENVRLVSRRGYSIPGAEAVKADLSSYTDTLNSVKNSDVVYLCAGLKYDASVWSVLWPAIMRNVFDACKSANAKLVFFDNVYMYGLVKGKMTETTPYNPCSKKGEIRGKIASLLEEEIKRKNINAIIARSADFYGPYAVKSSLPGILAIDKLMNGKKAQWLVDVDKPHSFTYTLDCAKALVLLSNRDECYNQTWHMPTYNPAINGKEFIELIANEVNSPASYTILSRWMIKFAGFFNGDIAGLYEMLYQNEHEYYFDSTKFNGFFNYKPVSYAEGIRETINFIRTRQTI
jgi:nucleoside-diphosphate-sugar epimerase